MEELADFGRRNCYVVVKNVFTVTDCKEEMFYSSRPTLSIEGLYGVKYFYDDVTVHSPSQPYFIWCLEPLIRRSNKFRGSRYSPWTFPARLLCEKCSAAVSHARCILFILFKHIAWLKETGAQTSSRVQRRGGGRARSEIWRSERKGPGDLALKGQ